jgi:hypothetical protein
MQRLLFHLTFWSLIVVFAGHALAQQPYVQEELKRDYEKVTGKKFAQEVKNAQASVASPGISNVVVRFNGGGENNRLYIGEKNRLEILIKNDRPLSGMSMGFGFTYTAGGGAFSWVEGYGDRPANAPHPKIVKIHGDAEGALTDLGGLQVNVRHLPDSVMIGGLAIATPLPVHSDTTLLYSMLVDIPAGDNVTTGGFCVDNIFFPPLGTWTFTDSGATGYPPLYQGNTNQSETIPSAPAVYFDVVKPCWQPLSGSMVVSESDQDELNKTQASNTGPLEAVVYGEGGRKMFRVFVYFYGDIQDLTRLGVVVDRLKLNNGTVLLVTFPVDLLPQVSAVEGVKKITAGDRVERNLIYSAPIVDGYYATIDSIHQLSGRDAVVGIIDDGIDWLHPDFRQCGPDVRPDLRRSSYSFQSAVWPGRSSG